MTASELFRRAGWQAIAAATSLVIALSAGRGIARGYEPIGDNALIELRGRDVLTGDHPWLGTWSSASISAGIDVNHPGPLIFDLVALPVRVFGGAAGIAVGVATLQIVVVWLTGYVTARVGGPTAAVTAMAVTAGLVWTLGSELLYDPWQPNVLVLPFWLFVCTVWAIAAGEITLLPLACAVGSFVMQTHLGYLFIVPSLLAVALLAMLRTLRGLRDRRALIGRPLVLSAGVVVVLWAQPIWEQFTGDGRGNLGRIVTAGTGGGDDFEPVANTRTGLELGVRTLGSVLALPPWWGRPGYDDSIPGSTQTVTDGGLDVAAPGLRTFLPSLAGLIALIAVLAVCWHVARRAGHRHVTTGFGVLAAALVVAALTVIVTPIDVLGLSPHKVRWLWVIGAFATYMIAMALLAGWSTAHRRQALAAIALVAVVAVLATVPRHANRSGPVYFEATYDSVADLRAQVSRYLDDVGTAATAATVVFDAGGIGFAEPYTAPVMAEFLEHGVDLVVDDPTLARQLGPDRRAAWPDPAEGGRRDLVYVRAGPDALTTPEGTLRVAFHDGEVTPYTVDDVTDRAVAVFLVPGGGADR